MRISSTKLQTAPLIALFQALRKFPVKPQKIQKEKYFSVILISDQQQVKLQQPAACEEQNQNHLLLGRARGAAKKIKFLNIQRDIMTDWSDASGFPRQQLVKGF